MKRAAWVLILGAFLLGCLPLNAGAVELDTAGKSACLMDVATGTVLYEKNAHERLAPASVTKIMTMLLIMEAIDGGELSWEDTVTASEAAAAKGGSQIYLKVGETMTVSDMVKSIAVSSANDCACAMAEHLAGSEAAFVEKMNQKAQDLGMADTHFVNCTGLDDSPEAREHLTSAYDVALMSRELLKNHPDIKKYTTIWMDSVRGGTFGLSNTNKLIRFYPGATGLKTGFTAGAGYCLSATARREELELIAVVMGAETSAARNASCKMLLDYGFAGYTLAIPELSHAQRVPVRLGSADSVEARLSTSDGLLVEKARKNTLTTEITLEEALTAPVAQGQQLGTLTLRSGEEILTQLPLVAAEPIPRLTYGQIFGKVLKKAAMG